MMFPGKEQTFDPEASILERWYTRILGVPVNGLRIRLQRVLPVTRGDYRRILDAGCGRGVFSMELAKQHPVANVVGVDVNSRLVERGNVIAHAAGLTNCKFLVGDVGRLTLDGGFDLVVSVDNLEHVKNDVGAMRELYRVLRPGGKLVVHVPGYYRRWPVFRKQVNFDVPGHVRPGYRKEELREKLCSVGFDIVRSEYTYGWLENLSNNISYAITGAEQRNHLVYALVFPLLLVLSSLGARSEPDWGAGVLAVASRPQTVR